MWGIMIGTLLLLGALVVVACWDKIREAYINHFQNWIELKCGQKFRLICDAIFNFSNTEITKLRRYYLVFKKKIKELKFFYEKKLTEDFIVTEDIVVQKDDGTFVKRETKSKQSKYDIPDEIRSKFENNQKNTIVCVDGLGIIEQKVQELTNAN